MRRFPKVIITRCHQYEVHAPHQWQCPEYALSDGLELIHNEETRRAASSYTMYSTALALFLI